MSTRVHPMLPLYGILCAACGLAAFALVWTPLTVGCIASTDVGGQRPLGSRCAPYTDGGLPHVLQSDPTTGMAIVAAAVLTLAVALGAVWFHRLHRAGGRSMIWVATVLLALALAWPVAFSHVGILSALFVPSLFYALFTVVSTFRPTLA